MSVFGEIKSPKFDISSVQGIAAHRYLRPTFRQIKKPSFQFKPLITLRNSIISGLCVLLSSTSVYATLDNTATVTGTPRAGTLPSPITASESVDLEDRVNGITVVKSAAITTDNDTDTLGDANDVITYTYTITNTGNTTLTGVRVDDTHDGSVALAAPGFDSWTTQASSPAATGGATSITMAPGAVAVFEITYTITTADILASGGGATVDDDLDNSAVAVGTSPGGAADDTSSAASTASIALDIDKSLSLLKTAYEGGLPATLGGSGTAITADRPVGTVITYVYAVTNDGNVPISNVGVTDVHSGQVALGAITYDSLTNTSGNSVYTTGNTIDLLQPNDVGYFTATYTITQADIDAQ